MSEFAPNTEYYGGYAQIKTDFSGNTHLYKIVNAIQSNSYCDVPIKYNSEPYVRKNIEYVLNVIHCGIDETNVVRVAVKDCDKVIPPTMVKHGKWKLGESGCVYFCNQCSYAAHPREVDEWDYCPNCGARMGGDNE